MEEKLTSEQQEALFLILKKRFEGNMNRHNNLLWEKVQAKLEANPKKLWSLNEMEKTGGEPDVVANATEEDEVIFYDCSKESPDRRSLCYDREALEARKKFKPENSVIDVAEEMGIQLLNEEEYQHLQKFGNFDIKTSNWLKTPEEIRKLGGAIFGDFRYGKVFIYHNGADSYYKSRGFRGLIKF